MQEIRSTLVTSIIITVIFILLLVILIVFIAFLYQRRHKIHKDNIDSLKNDYEKTLLASELEIKEQTFQNISREIHDNIGLSLTLAKLNLNTINWNDDKHIHTQVTHSIDSLSKAIIDLSQLSKTLHTDYIREQGLLNALQGELKKIEKTGVIRCHLKVTDTTTYMDDQKELVIFRIIQEALHNSIKHAQATSIFILMQYEKEQLIIKVADNGIGFTVKADIEGTNKGTGLLNITKRATMINGNCKVISRPGNGTLVELIVPYY